MKCSFRCVENLHATLYEKKQDLFHDICHRVDENVRALDAVFDKTSQHNTTFENQIVILALLQIVTNFNHDRSG